MFNFLSHQRSIWREEKVLRAASRVKSLKPHCVSRIPRTQKNHTRKWNPYIRNVRKRDRYGNTESSSEWSTLLFLRSLQRHKLTWATESFSRWALEPHAIAMFSYMWQRGVSTLVFSLKCARTQNLTGPELTSLSPASTFSMSENLVAPSASAIRISFPLELRVPFMTHTVGGTENNQTRFIHNTPENKELNRF